MATQVQAQHSNTRFVRRALQTDGVVCIASGAVFTLGAGALSPIVGVESPAIILGFGLFLLVYGVILYTQANRTPLDPRFPVIIIAANVLSVALCIFLLIADPFTFTSEGKWVTLILADVVAALGIWQFIGLRRMR